MSLNTKISIILLICVLAQYSYGQKYTVYKKRKSYAGLTGGMNFTLPQITDNYTVLSSTEDTYDESLEKEYDKLFQNTGIQFGIRYSYNFTNSFSIVAGLNYQSIGFNYFTQYQWIDTLSTHNFTREMHHLQKVSYFSIPVMVKWEAARNQLIPHVQAGVFIDFRHQAKKVIKYDNTIDNKETENQISSSSLVSISDQFKKFNMGLIAGVGISYHTKYASFGLESNFKYGFFKVMDDRERYKDKNGLALKYLDVMDQLKLSNLNVQFVITIPIQNAVSMNLLRRRRY